MKIDKYKDSIYIRFEERGENFTPIKTYPHYKQWIKVLNYLKRRGFTIKTPKYYIENNYAKAKHKVAYRNNVVITLELMTWQIAIEYGDIKNLWKDWEFNFWKLTDDRSIQLTYLESKKIDLEIKKLLDIFPKDIIIDNDESKLSSEELIIKDLKLNNHIHGEVTSLEDIKKSIESGVGKHNQGRNSLDKDEKTIICGDFKYFYDYCKRLSCGIVWHHINNMWWVLTPDGERYNKASFELFDYKGQPRRKELTKEQKINRLENELKRYENKKNYLRCMSINKQIKKLKATENTYHIWSLKWNKWWRANNDGYTEDKRYAGIYLESNVLNNQSYYNNGKSTKAIKI